MFGSAFGSNTSSIGSKMPLGLGLGTLQNPMKDVEVASPPDDSVSAIKFSPKASFFVASSWSNDVSLCPIIRVVTLLYYKTYKRTLISNCHQCLKHDC